LFFLLRLFCVTGCDGPARERGSGVALDDGSAERDIVLLIAAARDAAAADSDPLLRRFFFSRAPPFSEPGGSAGVDFEAVDSDNDGAGAGCI
jgi:hypothetical protein